mmetsp:Transcript_37068/g.86481  ORF Transcript_37068/g.86481 Transcript_37068/m.86481 type:complete len:88 (+) Transcript_37068:213-476(+)
MGNVFYFILSGKWPFSDTSSDQKVQNLIMHGERAFMPQEVLNTGDAAIRAIVSAIEKCWIDPPEDRVTAVEVKNDIGNVLAGYVDAE